MYVAHYLSETGFIDTLEGQQVQNSGSPSCLTAKSQSAPATCRCTSTRPPSKAFPSRRSHRCLGCSAARASGSAARGSRSRAGGYCRLISRSRRVLAAQGGDRVGQLSNLAGETFCAYARRVVRRYRAPQAASGRTARVGVPHPKGRRESRKRWVAEHKDQLERYQSNTGTQPRFSCKEETRNSAGGEATRHRRVRRQMRLLW